jgi:hypothetical protein
MVTQSRALVGNAKKCLAIEKGEDDQQRRSVDKGDNANEAAKVTPNKWPQAFVDGSKPTKRVEEE